MVAYKGKWPYDRWCECEYPVFVKGSVSVSCFLCGDYIRCEFCKMLATEIHIDYATCKEHLIVAIDNVNSRQW